MKFPKPNEIIIVFNKYFPKGKIRFFKCKSPDLKSPICVYMNGMLPKTTNQTEYWDRWEYPEPLPDCKLCKGTGVCSFQGNTRKCLCLTDPEIRNIKKGK